MNTLIMFKNLKYPVLAICMLLVVIGHGQSEIEQAPTTPAVSLIGEREMVFKELSVTHPGILLSVCGNDMDVAYDKWMEMLGEMEDYAESIDYDIKGMKTYMYVYWNPDGTIAHLSFFPKTKSRNIPINELKAFFTNFVAQYQMQVVTDTGFSHYASAAFPVFARPQYRVNKDD